MNSKSNKLIKRDLVIGSRRIINYFRTAILFTGIHTYIHAHVSTYVHISVIRNLLNGKIDEKQRGKREESA